MKNAKNIIYRINNRITAKEVRVIDETGKNLGVFPIEDAIKMAMEEAKDLIEVVPNANPPVAKIISFDKFRYQKEKEERKQYKSQQAKELKQVRVTPRAAHHDLELKAKQVEVFLEKGHRVEINLFLKGREKYNKNWGLQKLGEFLSMIKIPFLKSMEPKFVGKGFSIQIIKK